MKKLIIHLGPAKCGSSSIQDFFKWNVHLTVKKVSFFIINVEDIDRYNTLEFSSSIAKNLKISLIEKSKKCDVLVLSHEYLFQCPYAILNIFLVAKELKLETLLIGYSRRQSDFFVSAYHQWFFRSSESILETNKILCEIGIDGSFFMGIEKQMLAAIISDFKFGRHLFKNNLMDWKYGYQRIEDLLGEKEQIKVGTLPTESSRNNLILDFCEKAGIELKKKAIMNSYLISNTKFSPLLVEAICYVKENGIEIASPHADNKYFEKMSNLINSEIEMDYDIIHSMKNYIDSYFLNSNIEFCERFGLDQVYFKEESNYNKHHLIEKLRLEEKKRKLSKWQNEYSKKLIVSITNLCVNLSKV